MFSARFFLCFDKKYLLDVQSVLQPGSSDNPGEVAVTSSSGRRLEESRLQPWKNEMIKNGTLSMK